MTAQGKMRHTVRARWCVATAPPMLPSPGLPTGPEERPSPASGGEPKGRPGQGPEELHVLRVTGRKGREGHAKGAQEGAP